jgi:hypothetical protein
MKRILARELSFDFILEGSICRLIKVGILGVKSGPPQAD